MSPRIEPSLCRTHSWALCRASEPFRSVRFHNLELVAIPLPSNRSALDLETDHSFFSFLPYTVIFPSATFAK